MLLYGSSWALFWNTGVFFDRQAFAFLALNGVQIYHWVYPPLALAVLVATLVGSMAPGMVDAQMDLAQTARTRNGNSS